MLQLQPQDIAACFTLTQIEDRITKALIAIENAEQSKKDSFNDTQANQEVIRQNITELNNNLSVWIKAKNILTGSDTSTAELIAGNYNPALPRL